MFGNESGEDERTRLQRSVALIREANKYSHAFRPSRQKFYCLRRLCAATIVLNADACGGPAYRLLRLPIRIDDLAENEVDHRPQLRRAVALEILKAVDVHESLSNQFACDDSSGLNLSITRHWTPLVTAAYPTNSYWWPSIAVEHIFQRIGECSQ